MDCFAGNFIMEDIATELKRKPIGIDQNFNII